MTGIETLDSNFVTPCGIFDFESGASLGSLLILVDELLALNPGPRTQRLELAIFGASIADAAVFESGMRTSPRNEHAVPDAMTRLLSAISEIAEVRRISVFPTLDALLQAKPPVERSVDFYPSIEQVKSRSVEYGSTLLLQSVFARTGHLPYLSMRRERLSMALDWLERHVFPAVPVVVHLKNTGAGPLQSDADFKEWWAFFIHAAQTHPAVRFVLIGDDPIPAGYPPLDNVLRPTGGARCLAQDLALIQLAHSFLGMSSGPCQMALFSDVPYVIYKNPAQHVEHITREIGSRDRFPFAVGPQYFLRVTENRDNLHANFSRLWNEQGPECWQRRIADLMEGA